MTTSKHQPSNQTGSGGNLILCVQLHNIFFDMSSANHLVLACGSLAFIIILYAIDTLKFHRSIAIFKGCGVGLVFEME